MSAPWKLSVDGEALHFLLSARARDRAAVLDGLEKIVRVVRIGRIRGG